MSDSKEILPDVKNIKQKETYTLPSKGLVYTPEENIPASITLRRMTTKEDKIRLRNQSEDRIRKDLLQACIMEQGVNAGKLKLPDANFLLFRLRCLSLLDDTYKVQCMCRTCGTEFIHEINLLDVPTKFMTEDKLEDLSIELPICKAKIKLKYPSIDDTIIIEDVLKEFSINFPNQDRMEYLYNLGALLYIDSINNHFLMREELEQYLDDLDILDSRALRNAISKLDNVFGFDDNLYAKCPNCGKELQHGLPITEELFNPS